jgi:hypothetical protein
MRPHRACWWAACGLLTALASAARAGMPAPLPTADELERVWRTNDTALARLQVISFFLVVLLSSAAAVRWLWNSLAGDFPRWPRLSYGKALAGTLLLGLLFIIVLAMISGARELMTPGAWQKRGFTYQLAGATAEDVDRDALRKEQIERLRLALWHFAATHNGKFPSAHEAAGIPADVWVVPGSGGLRYHYVPGLSVEQPAALLACEPDLGERRRFVLRNNGDITALSSAELASMAKVEKGP